MGPGNSLFCQLNCQQLLSPEASPEPLKVPGHSFPCQLNCEPAVLSMNLTCNIFVKAVYLQSFLFSSTASCVDVPEPSTR